MLEDDGSSSDAGVSSTDEYGNSRERLNRSENDLDDDDDCNDLEQKIKFFFKRIEQQEADFHPMTTIEVSDIDSIKKMSLNDSLGESYLNSSIDTPHESENKLT